jgi:hypothetical protein
MSETGKWCVRTGTARSINYKQEVSDTDDDDKFIRCAKRESQNPSTRHSVITNTSEGTHDESEGGKTNTKVGFFKSLTHSIRTKREETSVHRVTSHYIHLQDIALSLLTLADFQNIVSVLIGLRYEASQCSAKGISVRKDWEGLGTYSLKAYFGKGGGLPLGGFWGFSVIC